MLPTLAAVLRADYILWGKLQDANGVVRVESAIYDGVAGRSLAKNVVQSQGKPGGEVTSELVQGLIRQASSQTADRKLQITMASLQRSPRQMRAAITRVSNTEPVEALILSAYELLEQATAFTAKDAESQTLLTQAERLLAEAVGADGDSRNPYAHYLLATCHYNQAQHYTQTGNAGGAGAQMRAFRAAMNRAFQNRGRATSDAIKRKSTPTLPCWSRKIPPRQSRPTKRWPAWASPRLRMTKTCHFPYRTRRSEPTGCWPESTAVIGTLTSNGFNRKKRVFT